LKNVFLLYNQSNIFSSFIVIIQNSNYLNICKVLKDGFVQLLFFCFTNFFKYSLQDNFLKQGSSTDITSQIMNFFIIVFHHIIVESLSIFQILKFLKNLKQNILIQLQTKI